MSLKRLRTDYTFALICFLGVVSICGIAPFAVLRFLHGQPLAGLADLAILAGISFVVIHVWRGGDLARAGLWAVLIANAGCVTVVVLVGLSAVFWVYPVLLVNYLLVDRFKAVAVSVVAVALIAALSDALDSPLQTFLFVTTAVVVSLFAFIFAQRTDKQREQLERLAAHDPLTGASNRLTMLSELNIAIENGRRAGLPVALAVLDLDHFKRVNDEFGHDGGDQVLVQFVRLVNARTRRGDRLFRYGGEEFVLLLPGADTAALQQLLETLRASVERGLGIDGHPVTVSIGGAIWSSDETAGQWLARADAAMYEAKHNGRNCVVLASPGPGVSGQPPA